MKTLTTKLWLLTIIAGICITAPAFAQNPIPVENAEISNVLKSVTGVKQFRNNESAISIFKAVFDTDLIPKSESHELYSRLYLVVSQTGEEPPCKVYVIKGLINPGKLSIRELDKFNVIVEFIAGPYDKRKAHAYKIDSQNLTVKLL